MDYFINICAKTLSVNVGNVINKLLNSIFYPVISSVSNWLTNELKKKNEESKKRIRLIDKNHMKEFKGMRNKICSRIDTIDKSRRKLKGNKHTEVREPD